MERYEIGNTTIADKGTMESQYQKMEIDREIYLERARDSAELTIPYLVPEKGSNSATNYPTPYQSVGSRGVMNLASKLMLALFPPQAPFFRLDVDDLIYKKIIHGELLDKSMFFHDKLTVIDYKNNIAALYTPFNKNYFKPEKVLL